MYPVSQLIWVFWFAYSSAQKQDNQVVPTLTCSKLKRFLHSEVELEWPLLLKNCGGDNQGKNHFIQKNPWLSLSFQPFIYHFFLIFFGRFLMFQVKSGQKGSSSIFFKLKIEEKTKAKFSPGGKKWENFFLLSSF